MHYTYLLTYKYTKWHKYSLLFQFIEVFLLLIRVKRAITHFKSEKKKKKKKTQIILINATRSQNCCVTLQVFVVCVCVQLTSGFLLLLLFDSFRSGCFAVSLVDCHCSRFRHRACAFLSTNRTVQFSGLNEM